MTERRADPFPGGTPHEIPAADPRVGFHTRIDRAVEELAAAKRAADQAGCPMTPEQVNRVELVIR